MKPNPMKSPYTYYLHRIRYRVYRRNGVPALAAWALAHFNPTH